MIDKVSTEDIMSWELWAVMNLAAAMVIMAVVHRQRFFRIMWTRKGFGSMLGLSLLGYMTGYVLMLMVLVVGFGISREDLTRLQLPIDFCAMGFCMLVAHLIVYKPRWFGIIPRASEETS